MTRKDKAVAVLERIVELCNEKDPRATSGQPVISFGSDAWGGNTLTIFLRESHTHVGIPYGSFEQLIDGLFNLLIKGEGLSWA